LSTILFSGRFDRPHIGHIATIGRLGIEYDKVIVVVLNYNKQTYAPEYRKQILEELLSMMKGEYEVVCHPTHFGKITAAMMRHEWDFDVYGSGNHDVLIHMAEIGVKSVYVERAYDYSATDDRNIQKIKEVLNER